MGLNTIDLLNLLLTYPELDQGYLGKQGQHHRRRWSRCRPFFPWNLLVIRAQVQTDLSLDHAVDQQAQHRQHRSRRDPFGLLEPHGADRRRILDPAKARFHRGILVLIGLENGGIAAHLSTPGCSQHHPAIVLLRVGARLHLHL
jgi:hypothetical protein